MKLLLVQSQHADAVAEFYRKVHGDDFAHPELLSTRTLTKLVEDQEVAIIAAADGDVILGCGLAWPQSWNQSLEIGALSVVGHPERKKIAKALFEAIRRLGLKKYGVAYFRASNEGAFKRGRDIGAMCWGFRHTAGSKTLSDAEMIMGFYEDGDSAMRIPPPDNLITQAPFARRIVESIGGEPGDMPYPKNFPVGAPRGTGTVVISGRIWPTYHSRGNFITLENTAGKYPVEVIREFVDKVREKGVSDVRLALPVNQEEAFKELMEFGFTPVAYLPGWFLRGLHRFDCVEMVAGLPRPPRNTTSFVERAVSKVLADLTLPD